MLQALTGIDQHSRAHGARLRHELPRSSPSDPPRDPVLCMTRVNAPRLTVTTPAGPLVAPGARNSAAARNGIATDGCPAAGRSTSTDSGVR